MRRIAVFFGGKIPVPEARIARINRNALQAGGFAALKGRRKRGALDWLLRVAYREPYRCRHGVITRSL
jgi:hypothetical protein